MLRRTAAFAVSAALVIAGAAAAAVPASAATVAFVPAAPTGLTYGTTGDDPILSWEAVEGATQYKIDLATDPSFSTGTIVATTQTYARSWVPLTQLGSILGRDLYWRVFALSGSTVGDASDVQAIWADPAPAPTLLMPADGGVVTYPDPVQFTWTPVPGAISYTITYSSDPGFPTGSTTYSSTVEGTSYTPAAMLNRKSGADDIVWSWRVAANFAPATGASSTSNFSGPASSVQQFSVVWPTNASTPTLLSPTDPGQVYSDPKFSWTPVAGAVKYHIEIGSASDGTNVTTILEYADTTATTYVPTEQWPDAVYWWTVWAIDPTNNKGGTPTPVSFTKAWGTQTGASIATASYTPAYPVPTFGSLPGAEETVVPLDELELTWQPLPRATLYEVEVVPHNGQPRLTCRTASTSATIIETAAPGSVSSEYAAGYGRCLWSTTAIARIQPGVEYTWRVRAVDFAGNAPDPLQGNGYTSGTRISPWSDPEGSDTSRERHFQVSEPPATGAVTSGADMAAWATERLASASKAAPEFRWNRVNGANVYDVDVYRDAALTNHVASFRTPQTVLRVNGVFDDTTAGGYYWTVRAAYTPDWTNFVYPGGSVSSDPVDWTKLSTPSDFVGVTPVTQLANGSVLLAWRPQAQSAPADGGSRGYRVQIFKSTDESLGSIDVENPWFVAANPINGKALTAGGYKFRVAPLDALGEPGSYSAKVSFDVAVPAPTALTAEVGAGDGAAAATSVRLTWANTSPYTKFVVDYAPHGTATWTTAPGTLVQTGTAVTNLAPGDYDWRVTTYLDATGTSRSAATYGETFTIAGPAPTPTTPVGATLTTADRRLSWEAVPGASRYLVRIADTSTAATTTSYTETAATSLVLPTNLVFGKQYYWTVAAVPEKKSTSSARVVLGISAPRAFQVVTPPGPITLATPKVTGTSIALSWTALTGAGAGSSQAPQYRLAYRAKNTTGTPDEWQVVELGSGVAATTLTGLALAQTYELKLMAYNAEGSGPWTSTREATTASLPGAVGNLLATPGYESLKVSWVRGADGGAAITGYHVQYRVAGTDVWSDAPGTTTSTSTTTTVTGLSGQKSYEVQVAAINAAGEGAIAITTAVTIGAPGKPRTVAVKRGDRSATVTWAAPAVNGGAAISGYLVDVRSYNATTKTWGAWATKLRPVASVTSAVVPSLVNGTKYQIRMASKTVYAQSAYTSVYTVTPAGLPSAPTSVKATAVKGKITVTWVKPSDNGSPLTGFTVQYSTNGTTWKNLASKTATTTKVDWTGATKGTRYYFRVLAKNAVGTSSPSSSAFVTAL
ncbi:hypothetical protein CCO02nite_01440 [Cellulomonas composti]|uniref:Fibronectin type-III domain-containing protein n=1 Tax=Cellulomonas composti TaxID=266130 RepID=A0A511J658_9CELL|nr:hypothetical protein CCO02nite_01440 [Cellulomonas composti]